LACGAAHAQQVQAPLSTFISGGAATGAVHSSTNIPTHFSTFGQPFVLPRSTGASDGGGMMNANELMFADVTSPLAINISPADESPSVPVDADLVITFDENIAPGTGAVVIYRLSDDGIVVSIPIGDPAVVFTSSQITISHADFGPALALYVLIDAGAIKDLSGNDYAGISASSTWNFTTAGIADVTPPSLTILSPSDDSGGVLIDASLSMTFDENVIAATGSVVVHRGSDDGVVMTIPIGDPSVVFSGPLVTISHPNFGSGLQLYVLIDAGAITDHSGNDYAGISSSSIWNFTTAGISDVTPPSVTTLSPADDSAAVLIDATLSMTFDENVIAATGNVVLHRGSDDGVVMTIPVGDPSVVFSGPLVTISHPDFGSGLQLYVLIDAGAITDHSGNDYAGISSSSIWNFTTAGIADATAPSVTALSPADDSGGVLVDADLSLTFDENVIAATGNVVVYRGSDDGVVMTIPIGNPGVVITGQQATITHADFGPALALYVLIDPGAIKDLSGNDYAGISSSSIWNFATAGIADVTPPSVTTLSPADDSGGVLVDADLSMTFDENVTAGTGNVVVYRSSDDVPVMTFPIGGQTITGQEVTISHADFLPGLQLYVLIDPGAIKDLSGNDYAGINSPSTWTFTTAGIADVTPPSVTSLSPPDDSADVLVDADLSLTFDENVTAGTGNIVVYRGSDDAVVVTVPIGDVAVAIAGPQVTFTHPDFGSGLPLYVLIDAGAIKDLSGNDYAGISSSSIWNFTTAGAPDASPPQLDSHSPSDNAIDVSVGSDLVLVFNEPIAKGAGNIEIKKVSDGSQVLSIDVTNSNVLITDGSTVTISLPADLPYNGSVYVLIASGAFKDFADNPYEGISDATAWNFDIEVDDSGPVIGDRTGSDDNVDPGQAADISVSFTDPETGVVTVQLDQRTLGSTDWIHSDDLALNGGRWTVSTTASLATNKGVEYRLIAFNGVGVSTTNGPYTVKINEADNGLIIPYSSFGHKSSSYRIVAVPLDLTAASVSSVFEDDLGPRKDKNWRVARYSNGSTNQEYEGQIRPGEGYWLIAEKDPHKQIDSGPGKTIDATSASPKTTAIAASWTQIGNPYNFNIAWSDLQNANPNLGKLRIYRNGTFEDGTMLYAMEGGFVFAETAGQMSFPPIESSLTARMAEAGRLRNPIDDRDWELCLRLDQDEMQNLISGIGMRNDASSGYDKYDGMSMPRFSDYLEVNHAGSVAGYHYSMDIVPTDSNHIWEFTVESSLRDGRLSFSWDNTYMGDNSKELVLFDITNQRPVDMKLNAGYQFDRTNANQFKIVFGDLSFIEDNTQVNRLVIHQVFPNPAGAEVNVAIGIPAGAWTSIELHDMLGRKLGSLFEGNLEKGHHVINTTRVDGAETGLYLIVVRALDQMAAERIILK
jgi:hypothetical protein